MNVVLGILLLVNGVWNFVVWPRFFKRVVKDERARDAGGKATPFLIVHAVLIGISLLIALVSLVFGVWAFFL